MADKTEIGMLFCRSVRSLANLNKGNTLAIFHFAEKRPVSIFLFMIIAKEGEIIGSATFKSLRDMSYRPLAL